MIQSNSISKTTLSGYRAQQPEREEKYTLFKIRRHFRFRDLKETDDRPFEISLKGEKGPKREWNCFPKIFWSKRGKPSVERASPSNVGG